MNTGAAVVATLVSPPFFMTYPRVVHHERIPADVLSRMQPAWRQRWFPARPVTLTIHENVYVVGEGLVFDANLDLIPSTVAQHQPHHIEHARTAIRTFHEVRWITRHDGTTVLCKKSGLNHYGHWLLELLPRSYFARAHVPDAARYLMHAVREPLRTVMRQSLAALGIGRDKWLETGPEPIFCERLLIVDGLSEHGGYMSPLVMECMDALKDRIEPAEDQNLFVTRDLAAGRCLVEQDWVEYLAQNCGYAIMDPSKLSFADQIAYFQAAPEVIGLAGSGLAGLAFARPGTKVINIAPASLPDTFFWFICGLRGLDYTEIRCAEVTETERRPLPQTTVEDPDMILAPEDLKLITGFSTLPDGVSDPGGLDLDHTLYPLFDPAFYRAQIPGAAGSDPQLFEHYVQIGWREGRDPSPIFNTRHYLEINDDVARAEVNPLLHYLAYGHAEQRTIAPSEIRP